MKINHNFYLTLILSFILTGCEHENIHFIVNDFEDIVFEKGNSYYNGSDLSGVLAGNVYVKEIATGTVSLINYYEQAGSDGFWSGFAVSSLTDTIGRTEISQYSSITGHGATSSSNYAVIRDSAHILLPCMEAYQQPKSVMLNNTAFGYYHMLEGSSFCREFAEGDWLKVIVTGMLDDEITGEVEFYLADFREVKPVLVRSWTRLNLRALGSVDKISFRLYSNYQKNECGHSLKYLCVDNLEIIVPENCPLLDEYGYQE